MSVCWHGRVHRFFIFTVQLMFCHLIDHRYGCNGMYEHARAMDSNQLALAEDKYAERARRLHQHQQGVKNLRDGTNSDKPGRQKTPAQDRPAQDFSRDSTACLKSLDSVCKQLSNGKF
jgi:hypothetical protein